MEPHRSRTVAARGALPGNGGFPEPPAGGPVRVVRASHDACGAETRVRLPGPVPARAVRRVICEQCERPFECEAVEDPTAAASVGDAGEAPPRPSRRLTLPSLTLPDWRLPDWRRWLAMPPGRMWRILSIPLAAAAVIVGLVLVQGSDEPAESERAAQAGAVESGDAKLVRQPGWSLALPAGWERVEGAAGAAFAATAPDGAADATLWIERDPALSFREFEARSLIQLRQLAGSAQVVERSAGPTPERTIVRLEADAPEGAGASAPYTVTLRASGPYRYYLSTSLQPGAPAAAVAAAELIHESFVPEPGEPAGAEGTP
jgi:hypothetical protein